ncbi:MULTISPECIES: SlyX family protein [Halomonadaceae]|nr:MULTISPECIES: SlyX family protein [Halomonas]
MPYGDSLARLEARLEELENRSAYQEHWLDELDRAVAHQEQRLAELVRLNELMQERLREQRSAPQDDLFNPHDEVPPHY